VDYRFKCCDISLFAVILIKNLDEKDVRMSYFFSGESSEQVVFNYQDSEQKKSAKNATDNFIKALNKLQALDKQIVLGSAICSAGWVGAWLFPLTTVSIMGAVWASYNLGLRQQVQL